MSRQGYLILHEKRSRPHVYYFSLEDGFLRYFASPGPNQKSVGEIRLSGCKIVVKAQKRPDGVPNSFFLETRKVFVKDRSYTLGKVMRVELSAASNEDRQEWGKALFSWQRYYWRDPNTPDDFDALTADKMTKMLLQEIIDQHFHIKEPLSSSLAVAKQPLSFLRRNAHSLRRSFSMSMSSSASTASSSQSLSASSKPEALSNITECIADKVQLTKVACPTTRTSRTGSYPTPTRGSNNQTTHMY